MLIKQQTIRRYIRDIRNFFPIFRKQERRFLNSFRKNVLETCSENSCLTQQVLHDTFGFPQNVACDYIKEISPDILIPAIQKRILIRRIFRIAAAILLTVIILFTLLFLYDYYCLDGVAEPVRKTLF